MKKLPLLVLLASVLSAFAQNLQTVKTYYDPYTKTKLHEVYSVTPNTPTKNGSYKEYDASGVIIVEAYYVNGLLDGPHKDYYSSQYDLNSRGKVGVSETYKKGKLNGISTEYAYPGGVKKTTKTIIYEVGERVEETDYYVSGQKASERDYKTGGYTEWYENGQKKEVGQYDTYGYKAGSYTKWYDNGTVMESKKDSVGTILSFEYHELGGKTYLVAQTPGGKCISTTLDTTGKKLEEAESKPSGRTPPFYYDGNYTAYWPTGEVRTTGQYKNGQRVGRWKYLAIDGKLLSDAEWPQGMAKLKEEIRRLIPEKSALLNNGEVDKVEALLKSGTDDGYQQALDILRGK